MASRDQKGGEEGSSRQGGTGCCWGMRGDPERPGPVAAAAASAAAVHTSVYKLACAYMCVCVRVRARMYTGMYVSAARPCHSPMEATSLQSPAVMAQKSLKRVVSKAVARETTLEIVSSFC
eukprot:1142410-Pelagomonas_calceolata.AAC.4